MLKQQSQHALSFRRVNLSEDQPGATVCCQSLVKRTCRPRTVSFLCPCCTRSAHPTRRVHAASAQQAILQSFLGHQLAWNLLHSPDRPRQQADPRSSPRSFRRRHCRVWQLDLQQLQLQQPPQPARNREPRASLASEDGHKAQALAAADESFHIETQVAAEIAHQLRIISWAES